MAFASDNLELNQRLAAIQAKIAAKGHRFGPPLTETALRDFETRHRIELPEDYRRFLMAVGNGGNGPPKFGLMPLGEAPRGLPQAWEEEWRTLPHLEKPFPLTETWVWEGEEENLDRQNALRHGTLNLGHDGCGLYWLLIVSGANRGQIWVLADVGVCPLEPRRDFLGWIEAWLDGTPFWSEPNSPAG